MRVRAISFDVQGESGHSFACVAPDARIFHSSSRVPLRVWLPDTRTGQNMKSKGCFFVSSAVFSCALCGQKLLTAEDAEGSLSSRRKSRRRTGAGTPGSSASRRHRLRSNPPVRLTPRADAGSCSSLQFSSPGGRHRRRDRGAEIMRGDDLCKIFVEL